MEAGAKWEIHLTPALSVETEREETEISKFLNYKVDALGLSCDIIEIYYGGTIYG